ncbi:hypothetical protein [Nocardia farcinica]|uniref:hypothetical protein n=1 Tax=Nocardia farcinica TaxID=37329 RepID=UPI0037B83E87
MTDLHIIYGEAGPDYGWTIESPQIPELIGGRKTIAELIRDTPDIIEFAKDPGQTFDQLYRHEQHLVTDPTGDEYLIRWTHSDPDTYDARERTAAHLNYAVLAGLYGPNEKARQPRLVTTERLLIAVEPDDLIGWILDQLDVGGCAVLSHNAGEGAIWSLPIGKDSQLFGDRWTFERLGVTRDQTFAQALDSVIGKESDAIDRVTGLHVEQIADTIDPALLTKRL